MPSQVYPLAHSRRLPLWPALTLTALLAFSLALPLSAQGPDGLSGTADFGFVNAAGNTEVTTLNLGQEMLFGAGPWGVKQTFGAVYGRTEGEVSASSWRSSLRGDRTLVGRMGAYLLVAWDRNTFAGVARRFEEGLGLVLRPVDTDSDRLEFEGGAGFTQVLSTDDVSESFVSARAAATYRRSLGEASHAQISTEFLPNLENSDALRVNSIAELVAPISQRIATKLSYAIRYDREPLAGFRSTDRIFTAGLQVSF